MTLNKIVIITLYFSVVVVFVDRKRKSKICSEIILITNKN